MLTGSQPGQESRYVNVFHAPSIAENGPAHQQRYVRQLQGTFSTEPVGQIAGRQRTDGTQQEWKTGCGTHKHIL